MFSQASVSHSVHNRPHDYSVTVHPCYGVVGYASYSNAFLLFLEIFIASVKEIIIVLDLPWSILLHSHSVFSRVF